MAARVLETLAPHLQIVAASSMAASSAVARRVVNRTAAFSTSAPSSAFSLYALRASDEAVAAIRGHLAAAARRAALHAAAAPEVRGSRLLLPSPLEPDLSAPPLASTGPGGEATSSTSTPRPASASSPSTGPGGKDLATSTSSTSPRLAFASSSSTGPGGKYLATSTPAPSSSIILFYAADWARGADGHTYSSSSRVVPFNALLVRPGALSSTPPDLLLASSTNASGANPMLLAASDAHNGLLLLLDKPTSTTRFDYLPAVVKPILLSKEACSTPFFSSGPNARRFFSACPCPTKGPNPPAPAIRDAQFIISLMNGMVLSSDELVQLRDAIDKKLNKEAVNRLERLESKVDLILDNLHAGNNLIMKTLLQGKEWGTIKLFGRELDLTKIAGVVRSIFLFITTGSV